MFCTRTNITNDAGFADIDWIRFDKARIVIDEQFATISAGVRRNKSLIVVILLI